MTPPSRAPYINNKALQQKGPPEEGFGRRLMDVRQLSEYSALPMATIYTWVSLRRIPEDCIVHLGRSLRFDREAIDRWISAQRAGRPSPPA